MSNLPIFVVNLERDIEKRQHMVALAKKRNLDLTFTNAVLGKNLSREEIKHHYDDVKAMSDFGRKLTLPELGCALSHLNIYKSMIEKNIQIAIVLEDDVELSESFKALVNQVDNFPDKWELMLLGYYSETASERLTYSSFWGKHKVSKNLKAVKLTELAFGTHGYMINIQGAKKLVEILSNIYKPIDHYTGASLYLNTYGIVPRVVSLNEKYKAMSCISSDRDNILDNKKNFLKTIKNRLKKIKILFWLKKLPKRLKF
ncbi:glycosyltransferase family 25 protein [Pseudoalteromonas distincta]|uniref:glycosyltransferase family 25 protein n=1 Tax=Pseudoalteromonas distincta TaxID=77608 RepID=UPI00165F6476|nr:glycosyltransferase family 25 protein [Pseudoalteromonas distincta]